MEIGKVIKENRTARNMTQEDLAKEFFVSRPLISKWENGKSYPDLEQLLKLSDFFDLTLDELLRGDKKMTKKLNLSTKTKKIMLGTIISLSIGVGGVVFYNYWSKESIQLKPEDIEIVSIETTRIPEETKFSLLTNKEELDPGDVGYKIRLKSKKKFVTIKQAYVPNDVVLGLSDIYVRVRAEHSLFKSQESEYLVIEPKLGSGYDGEKIDYFRNLDKSIYLLDNEKFENIASPFDKGEELINISWKLIDKSELK